MGLFFFFATQRESTNQLSLPGKLGALFQTTAVHKTEIFREVLL